MKKELEELLPYSIGMDEGGFLCASVANCRAPSSVIVSMNKHKFFKVGLTSWHPRTKRCYIQIMPTSVFEYRSEFSKLLEYYSDFSIPRKPISLVWYKIYKKAIEDESLMSFNIEIKDIGSAILVSSTTYKDGEIVIPSEMSGHNLIFNILKNNHSSVIYE